MDWLEYREKLGIGFHDEKRKNLFFTQLFNYLSDTKLVVSNTEHLMFCNTVGLTYSTRYNGYMSFFLYLQECKPDFLEVLSTYIAFVNCLAEYPEDRRYLINILECCLQNTHIQYEIIREGEKYYVFPGGAKELDDALVSQPLQWLEAYPKSHVVFVQALKKYASPNNNDARTIADEFRKALEGFFQEFFGSTKSIENLKSEYGKYLKDRGIPAEVSNSLQKLLELYNSYMNDYVKHQNNTQQNVLEYIMYQTGNIIRLLITLKNAENEQ